MSELDCIRRDLHETKQMVIGLTRRQTGKPAEARQRTLVRSMLCKLLAVAERHDDARAIAERRFPGNAAVLECLADPGAFVTKATPPAMTTVAGWAAELTTSALNSALQSVAPFSVFSELAKRGLAVSFPQGVTSIRLPFRTSSGELGGAFVGEAQGIPMRRLGLGAVNLINYKMGVISAFTREMAQQSTPQIETIIQRAMSDDTAIVVDAALLDASAGTALRPPGLLNGIAPLTPTAGGGAAALIADIGKLSVAVPKARAVVFLMSQAMAARAALWSPGFAALDVVIAPALAEGTVVAIDADDLALAESAADFSISEEATLVMSDSTPVPDLSTMATMSTFQTASLGIRSIFGVSWVMRRPNRIATIASVTW